MIVATEFIYN